MEKEDVFHTGEGILAQLDKFEVWGAYTDFTREKVLQCVLNAYRNKKS